MSIFQKITHHTIDFSPQEWLFKHKIEALSFILFFSSFLLLIFTFIRYFTNDITTAFTDGIGAIVFFLMYLLVKKDKKYYDIVSNICAITITVVITIAVAVSNGDLERSIWFFSILVYVYFFRDSKEATYWLIALIAIISFIHVLSENSNMVTYFILVFNMILMSVILYFYEKIKAQEYSNLMNQNEYLEEKVALRTKELDEINKHLEERVKEEINKNILKDKMMVQQNKMAMIGEMIGNIAHQFRQPLSAINATTSVTKFELEMDSIQKDELKTKLNNIENYVHHLSDTIEDFRNFFKEDKEKTTFNLSQSIEKDLFIIESTFLANTIEIIKEYDESIEVSQFRNELTQCILNILNNAKDALRESEVPQKLVFIETKIENNKTKIIIKDNGCGIPESVLPHIFEDKFTTKDDSNGTGIGLFMTKQMIETHMDGKINAKNTKFIYNNEYYKGAEFTIIL
ncbi:MAG TPA: GHKL domain-containing protein [Arcobacter sp.]|nr:GHKL domain-containing protein [Arcobacter sp.]